MKPTTNLIRKHIQEMPPYEPILPLDVLADELGLPIEKLIKLDANENPYGPIPEVNAGLALLNNLHIYPDPESRHIRKILSSHHEIPEEKFVISAGADELIDLIMRLGLDAGDAMIHCPPTFGMYAFDGMLNQAQLVIVPREPDFSLNIPEIERAVEKFQPKMIFLASPNNPDGGTIQEGEIRRLANLPLLLVIDEAYINFSEQGQSALNMLNHPANLIVLRTFSKWAGLAGLRIGYGIFPENLASTLMKAKQPYNVSVAAEAAAVLTMKNIKKAEQRISLIIEERSRLFNELDRIPWIEPYPSQANFILCRVKELQASEVRDRLRETGILVRYFDQPRIRDHIRITVGTPEQINALIMGLKRIR